MAVRKSAAPAPIIAPPPTVVATTRPVTCAEMYRVDSTLGAVGCHRLPRHKGEHRATLTLAATRKAARDKARKAAPKSAPKTATKRVTPAQKKRAAYADIAERMAAGTISPSDAMAEVSALA